MNNESFIYTLSNREVKNGKVDPIEYDVMIGDFNSQNENFRFELIGFNIESNFDFLNDQYIIVVFDNLASNGVFSRSIVGSDKVLVPIVLNNATSGEYKSNGGSNIFLNVNNCRMQREIKIRILNSSLDPITVGATDGADWLITFKVTPI